VSSLSQLRKGTLFPSIIITRSSRYLLLPEFFKLITFMIKLKADYETVITFLFIIDFVSSPEVTAQKRKSERAYSSFAAGEYFDAIDLFKDAYSKTKKADKNSRTELVFMIAECYRLTNDPKNAETWYKLAVKSSFSKPDAEFWLAESLKRMASILLRLMNLKNTNK